MDKISIILDFEFFTDFICNASDCLIIFIVIYIISFRAKSYFKQIEKAIFILSMCLTL